MGLRLHRKIWSRCIIRCTLFFHQPIGLSLVDYLAVEPFVTLLGLFAVLGRPVEG